MFRRRHLSRLGGEIGGHANGEQGRRGGEAYQREQSSITGGIGRDGGRLLHVESAHVSGAKRSGGRQDRSENNQVSAQNAEKQARFSNPRCQHGPLRQVRPIEVADEHEGVQLKMTSQDPVHASQSDIRGKDEERNACQEPSPAGAQGRRCHEEGAEREQHGDKDRERVRFDQQHRSDERT